MPIAAVLTWASTVAAVTIALALTAFPAFAATVQVGKVVGIADGDPLPCSSATNCGLSPIPALATRRVHSESSKT